MKIDENGKVGVSALDQYSLAPLTSYLRIFRIKFRANYKRLRGDEATLISSASAHAHAYAYAYAYVSARLIPALIAYVINTYSGGLSKHLHLP